VKCHIANIRNVLEPFCPKHCSLVLFTESLWAILLDGRRAALGADGRLVGALRTVPGRGADGCSSTGLHPPMALAWAHGQPNRLRGVVGGSSGGGWVS